MTYEEAAATVKPGLYRHFKGNCYRVLSIARHSETSEPMVVYKALYGDGGLWVRPADMWNETVERDGKTFRRFHPLSREERVAFYEKIYDELKAVPAEAGLKIGAEEIRLKLALLDEYYTSGEWLEDYEADEAGLLPKDMKRGVLSQDGLYDLLEEWRDL
jgi:hypothetical protein